MKNSSVITNESVKKHFVENYRFKILGSEIRQQEPQNLKNEKALDDDSLPQDESQASEIQTFANPIYQQPSQQPNGFDSNFVEELLKKTDELSTNIVKLQMQIENQEIEFNKRLEAETQRAKEDGKSEGLAEADIKFKGIIDELNERFKSSVDKLSQKFDSLDEFIIKNEEELAKTAINVAKQIIEAEISQNSSKIAFNLCKKLLDDIKDAKDITLRVNPDDGVYLKEQFGNKAHIKIEIDDAISKGGVVIISEVGNIDATIATRFEKMSSLIG